VQALAERLRAPVLIDGFVKGLVPEDHPLALGCAYAPTSPAEDLMRAADLVLVIGAPQGRAALGKRSPEQLARQLILVDWDDRDQHAYPARARLQGPVPGILRGLLDALEPTVAAEGFGSERVEAARRFPWEAAAERIPWALPFYHGLRAALPRDGILLTDSLAALWADRLVPAYAPNTIRFPQGTGTLGWGAPAAVGVKAANPDREVVVLAGDGAFLYNPQELATMQLYRQKLTMIVANDNCYSAIKHNMNENFGRSTAYELVNPDFVRFGEAFGMRAVRLETPDAIEGALRDALAGDRSTLIEVPLELMPPKRFTQ
jgi:thiamine pyrophosphate-dependent acetolactate synthase large subunit-like protein